MALTSTAPVFSGTPPPVAAGTQTLSPAAAATLQYLSSTPQLHHPQPNNPAGGCGYRAAAYSMIQYYSGHFSPCDPMAMPSPTAFPLLTPPSSSALQTIRTPSFLPPAQTAGIHYKPQAADKCATSKSQEAATALISLQREPIVMSASIQPHPSSNVPLQESPASLANGALNIPETSCPHPDLHMETLSPPVLSHCSEVVATSPPTLSPMMGTATPLSTQQHIGSLLQHLHPNYPYIPLNPHDFLGGSYPCDICGKAYARLSTLRSHLKSHNGEKPYQCSICHKSFTQATNLTAHLRTHSGEKPFTCPVCHRGFSQSSSVTTHMRTHSGDRPYKCNVCNKGFADSSTLTKHYRTHTGEKPYQCKICEARFSQSGNLNRHMRTHRHFPIETALH